MFRFENEYCTVYSIENVQYEYCKFIMHLALMIRPRTCKFYTRICFDTSDILYFVYIQVICFAKELTLVFILYE